MKRIYLVWMGALLIFLLAACGTSAGNTDPAENQANKEEASAEPVHKKLNQQKQIDAAEVANKARYTFMLEQNKGNYNIYIYAEDERESKADADSACANKGDRIFGGDYFVAAVEKGSDRAKVVPIGEQTFQVPNDGVNVIAGEPSLLVVSHCEASDMYNAELFVIDAAGKPVQLKQDDGEKLVMNASPERIKSSGKNTYQSAVFSNASETNWTFYNWQLDPDSYVLKLKGKVVPADPAKLDVTKWAEDPNYIVK